MQRGHLHAPASQQGLLLIFREKEIQARILASLQDTVEQVSSQPYAPKCYRTRQKQAL